MSKLQDLYNHFDGATDGNRRLAYYGQCRAEGMNHKRAMFHTFSQFESWCREIWPKRGISVERFLAEYPDKYDGQSWPIGGLD